MTTVTTGRQQMAWCQRRYTKFGNL